MYLYNSLSRKVEALAPPEEPITIYVCGITPYDATHLGHAFTYTVLDVLIRYLRFQNYHVNYVQNVTDVDDDILRKAGELGEDWKALGDQWTARYIREMVGLNVVPPDRLPRATDVMPEIIDVVERLLETGVAYESGGSVYFHVEAWTEFGKLSRLSRDEMLPIANERGNDPNDPNKRNPLDFVLWQAQAAGEPSWDSPWGPGRPGWHIECSTMAMHFLGRKIDIHSGGADLIFPHHECEIAQAEGATGEKPFVRYWVHVAMVRHEGEKMSKSLGNLVMMQDLLERWSSDALRLYLGSHHYRSAWSHSLQELERADKLAEKLRKAVVARGGDLEAPEVGSITTTFVAAMDDDLDTPAAVAALERLGDTILDAAAEGHDVLSAQVSLRSMSKVLGLRLDIERPEQSLVDRWHRFREDFI